jgi:predicted DNA-binding transcriptional regulator YafY
MTTDTNSESGLPASSAEERSGGIASSAIVRTQRALQILRILQAGQVWSAAELAAQFDCSTRTIFRDLQLLRECGIPIDSPRGEKGFKLSHDFFWQPERPTLEEMIALVLGARMAKDAMPKDMAKNLSTAVAKLVGSEKPAVRQRLTQLNMRIDAPHLLPQGAWPEVEYLPLLLEHILAQTRIRVVLAGQLPSGVAEVLEVIPVRLQFTGEWMLVTTAWEGGSELAVPLTRIERVETPPDNRGAPPAGPSAAPAAEASAVEQAVAEQPAAARPADPAIASSDTPTEAAGASEAQTTSVTDSE